MMVYMFLLLEFYGKYILTTYMLSVIRFQISSLTHGTQKTYEALGQYAAGYFYF